MSALLSRAEAAEFCHVSVDAFDEHVRPQLPPPKRVGRRVLFLRTDLEAWAQGERVAPSVARAAPPPRRLTTAQPPSSASERGAELLDRARRTTARERIAAGTGTPEDVEHVRKLDGRYARSEERRRERAELTPLQRRREQIRQARR